MKMDKNMHKKLKNPHYGTANLHKRAETWVWVVPDVQNFALRAPCSPFATHIYPSCSLQKATKHILYWIGASEGSKKDPKVRKHGVTVFGQVRVRTTGGGGV